MNSTRDGLYVVTGSTWKGDGTMSVRVVEMIGERPDDSQWNARRIRRARDLAKRELSGARFSRLDGEAYEMGQTAWAFTIARNDILR